jgi:hypothetical protein
METRLSKNGRLSFSTTGNPNEFGKAASMFWGATIEAEKVALNQ